MTMAEFYAYWILAGKMAIDRVPKKLRDKVQALVDESLNGGTESTD